MGLETATYIGDLVPTNPTSSDFRNQGDDHLRLTKAVLQNSFPGLEKAIYFPTTISITLDRVVLAAEMNATFLANTAAGSMLLTLPTLGPSDAGWQCFLIKTSSDVNVVYVAPPSGTLTSGSISGITMARRCIPGARITCLWTGTTFIISRAVSVPVGAIIELGVSGTPVGYEFPNGQTLGAAATNYQEFYASNGNSGVTADKRGRVGVALDNLGGSSAGRVGAIIDGNTVRATGGTERVALGLSELPTGINSSNLASIAINVTSTTPNTATGTIQSGSVTGGADKLFTNNGQNIAIASSGTLAIGAVPVTSNNTGAGSHSNLQPSIMLVQVLVVE